MQLFQVDQFKPVLTKDKLATCKFIDYKITTHQNKPTLHLYFLVKGETEDKMITSYLWLSGSIVKKALLNLGCNINQISTDKELCTFLNSIKDKEYLAEVGLNQSKYQWQLESTTLQPVTSASNKKRNRVETTLDDVNYSYMKSLQLQKRVPMAIILREIIEEKRLNTYPC